MFACTHFGAWIWIVLTAVVLAASCSLAAEGVGNFRGHGVGAARIVLEKTALERGQPIEGVFVLPTSAIGPPAAGKAQAALRVSDSLGRLLAERTIALKGTQMPFKIEVPGVLVMKHSVSVATGGPAAPRAASADFLYMPPKEWDDYICTIWHRHNEKRIPYLQEMYLSGSQWTGSSSHLPEHFIDANYRYYLETGATWVFAPYHMWMPDKEKTYYHKQAKKAFIADRTNFRILERNPCLSNHHTRRRIEWTFTHQARMHRLTRPLFYTIADEPGIANQAAPFDYCFSPHCKKAFRAWLKQRYGTLEAMNKQWGSDYGKWDDVRGATTDEIFRRKDENFSAWCDHKDFMDDVLIGGSTAFDPDDDNLTPDFADNLLALLDEWNSGNDFDTRVAHLTGAEPGGLNGSVLLDNTTVFDDGQPDRLTGSSKLSTNSNKVLA